MENAFLFIGFVFFVLGGFLLFIATVRLLLWGVCYQLRAICKGISMFFEYRKYREQFLRWIAKIKSGGAGSAGEEM